MEPIRTQLPFTGVMTSNIGGRKENQDSCGYSETPAGLLLVVCDGMGGGPGGKTASSIAASTIVAYVQKQGAAEADAAPVDSETLLHDAVVAANRALRAKIQESPELDGMGTTVTAVLLTPTGAVLAHVGDSRIYQLHHRKIAYRTADHSLVAEMVRAKQQTEEQARLASNSNIITRALGIKDEVKVDTVTLPYRRGDRFVLCTDGIWGAMPQPELVRTLTENPSPENTAEVLNLKVENAGQQFKGGRHDNYTLIIADARNDSAAPTKAAISSAAGTAAENTPTDAKLNPGADAGSSSPADRGFRNSLKKTDSRILALIITGIIITPLIIYLLIYMPGSSPDQTAGGEDPEKTTVETDSVQTDTTGTVAPEPDDAPHDAPQTHDNPTNGSAPTTGKVTDRVEADATHRTESAETAESTEAPNNQTDDNQDDQAASVTELQDHRAALQKILNKISTISDKVQRLDSMYKRYKGNTTIPDMPKKTINGIIDFLNEEIINLEHTAKNYLTDVEYNLIYGNIDNRNYPEALDSRYPGLKGQFENTDLKSKIGYEANNYLRYRVITDEIRQLRKSLDERINEINEQLNE